MSASELRASYQRTRALHDRAAEVARTEAVLIDGEKVACLETQVSIYRNALHMMRLEVLRLSGGDRRKPWTRESCRAILKAGRECSRRAMRLVDGVPHCNRCANRSESEDPTLHLALELDRRRRAMPPTPWENAG